MILKCRVDDEQFLNRIIKENGHIRIVDTDYQDDGEVAVFEIEEISKNKIECDYTLQFKFVNKDSEEVSFAETDLLNLIGDDKKILSITDFSVPKEHRNKGIGTEVLENFCNTWGKDHIIIVVIGVSKEEYPVEPNRGEFKKILQRLEKFYTHVGFANVNKAIGQYESKIAMIYNGGVGRDVIENILTKNVHKTAF